MEIARQQDLAGPPPAAVPAVLQLTPSVAAETMLENMRSAVARGLPEVRVCKPHGHTLCIAGGGPSLADTYKAMTLYGDPRCYVAAINGSLRWLLEHGFVPDACAVMDPGEAMADQIEVDLRVRYFIGSTCHPNVFDKLAGCAVHIWHPSGTPGDVALLSEIQPEKWFMIGGGTTMGTRWLNLGYVCGFRAFHLHGMDSSFRNGSTHAYPDHRDGQKPLEIDGHHTSLNFLAQIADFFAIMGRFQQPDMEPTEVEVFGDGLLQERWRARVQ